MKQDLQIDREFMNLTIPLAEEEQEKLERSLMRDGCMEPVIVWRGFILDGHKRYKFCDYEGIDYEIQEMGFASHEEAAMWICRERIEGMSIHTPMFRYLSGKMYSYKQLVNRELRKQQSTKEYDVQAAQHLISETAQHSVSETASDEQKSGEQTADAAKSRTEQGEMKQWLDGSDGGNSTEGHPSEAGNTLSDSLLSDHENTGPQKIARYKLERVSIWDTGYRLAEELGVARSTLDRNRTFANAMDVIANMEPVLFEAILRGDVIFKQKEVLEMSKMDARQLGKIRRKKLGRKDIKMRHRGEDKYSEYIGNGDDAMEEEIPITTGIKEMPAFDPDMEINGLSFTIPSWMNRIARAEKNSDMQQATDQAKQQLAEKLKRLEEQIRHTLEVLT